jgi:ubiquinone/menaquinone biosynthesis C-methylase UbiE
MDRRPEADLYDPAYVRSLFDAMATTYERVNTATSFGFSRPWRRQTADLLRLEPGMVVLDAMTGMGEGWPYLRLDLARIVALDLSPGMLRHAVARRARMTALVVGHRRARWPGRAQPPAKPSAPAIDIAEVDACATSLPDASVDAVPCLFGLKTLSPAQQHVFAAEVVRILRPGGRYSLIEVSVPRNALLRVPYLFYLRRIVPILGRLLLGDPENYRMLGVYTAAFGDARRALPAFHAAGLEAAFVERFFGCATGIVGSKPASRHTQPVTAGGAT